MYKIDRRGGVQKSYTRTDPFFQKRVFFKGGHNVAKGGTKKFALTPANCAPPPKQKPSYAPAPNLAHVK